MAVDLATSAIGRRPQRIKFNGAIEIGQRLFKIAFAAVSEASPAKSWREFRIELYGHVKIQYGLVILALESIGSGSEPIGLRDLLVATPSFLDYGGGAETAWLGVLEWQSVQS